MTNNDMPNGQTNGSRARLEHLVLKGDKTTSNVSLDALECPMVDASDVGHFVCRYEDDNNKMFHMKPRSVTCAINAPFLTPSEEMSKPLSISSWFAPDANVGKHCCCWPQVVRARQTNEKLVTSVWSRKHWNCMTLSHVQTREVSF